MWESNPPKRLLTPRIGFEDRRAHQHPSTPISVSCCIQGGNRPDSLRLAAVSVLCHAQNAAAILSTAVMRLRQFLSGVFLPFPSVTVDFPSDKESPGRRKFWQRLLSLRLALLYRYAQQEYLLFQFVLRSLHRNVYKSLRCLSG